MYLVKGMRNHRFATSAFALVVIAASAAGSLLAQTSQSSPNDQNPQQIQIPTTPEAAPVTRYDNRYEIYGGLAYKHMKAGPTLLQGANIGGFDVQGTRWFSSRWGAIANVRGYYGTSGVAPNTYGIEGPFVSEHIFAAGGTWRGPRNAHGALTAHALVGGTYGYFSRGLDGHPNGSLGFFNDQLAPAGIFGGTIVLNRSPRWAMQISPDDIYTHYGSQSQNNFAISVGVLYRFTNKKK